MTLTGDAYGRQTFPCCRPALVFRVYDSLQYDEVVIRAISVDLSIIVGALFILLPGRSHQLQPDSVAVVDTIPARLHIVVGEYWAGRYLFTGVDYVA